MKARKAKTSFLQNEPNFQIQFPAKCGSFRKAKSP
jgi:hypothetical protein